jgi:hypothetical protein
MSGIPEDVWVSARETFDLVRGLQGELSHAKITVIANAILAERERCAKLAETVPPAKDIVSPERWVPITDDYGEPTGMMMKKGEVHRVNFRRSIAAAIRALDCFPEVE